MKFRITSTCDSVSSSPSGQDGKKIRYAKFQCKFVVEPLVVATYFVYGSLFLGVSLLRKYHWFRHCWFVVEQESIAYKNGNPDTHRIYEVTSRYRDTVYIPYRNLIITLFTNATIPTRTSSPFYEHGLTLIPAWISNHIHGNIWDGINHPFLNFNGANVEV